MSLCSVRWLNPSLRVITCIGLLKPADFVFGPATINVYMFVCMYLGLLLFGLYNCWNLLTHIFISMKYDYVPFVSEENVSWDIFFIGKI